MSGEWEKTGRQAFFPAGSFNSRTHRRRWREEPIKIIRMGTVIFVISSLVLGGGQCLLGGDSVTVDLLMCYRGCATEYTQSGSHPNMMENQPWLVRVVSPYYHHESCSVRSLLGGQIHSLYFISTLCVLCGVHCTLYTPQSNRVSLKTCRSLKW